MRLSEVAQGRDNNFNLIRFVAAYSVLFSHCFALLAGTPDAEPLRSIIGMTPGSIALEVFFITSGFLVTASLMTRKSLTEFFAARVLRIYPALVVMVLITVLVIGPYFTTYDYWGYLSDQGSFEYFRKNATMVFGASYVLPGVFSDLPIKGVNGSLWSLPYEIRMYVLLLVIWSGTLLLVPQRQRRAWLFGLLIVLVAVVSLAMFFGYKLYLNVLRDDLRLLYLFFMGAAFYVVKDKINLSSRLFAVLLATVLLSSINMELFFVAYYLCVAYIVLWLAYIPDGSIRSFNNLGDYSYGIYIYAYVVQQSILALAPEISLFEFLLVASVVTFGCAFLSWHLLEKHALKLKGHVVESLRACKRRLAS